MRIYLSTSKWYDDLWAALMFFTRLPLWKLYQPPHESFARVVAFWPLTGWLTSLVTAIVIMTSYPLAGLSLSILFGLAARLLLTGGLHEDGLSDFLDGFGGGGGDRQRILTIMKDSHIGTYGVLSLTFYYLIIYHVLHELQQVSVIVSCILIADPFCKLISSQLTQMLPYARTAETAKNKVVYKPFGWAQGVGLVMQGLLPVLLLYAIKSSGLTSYPIAIPPYECFFVPGIVFYLLYRMIHSKLKGYTGDCCGAVFLLTELSFYIACLAWLKLATIA